MDEVPARVGGVDLSWKTRHGCTLLIVPARVGGVDLSEDALEYRHAYRGPRPCGRGGFKQQLRCDESIPDVSPPVWAGWI